MEKKDNLSLYRETFLKKTHYTARDGKQVYIPVIYHEKMLKIVQLICSNRVNISDLLCNMLEEHFRTHGEELKALYECSQCNMKSTEINSLIANCVLQMRLDGYDEKCIETHQRRWQKGIVTYMHKTGTTLFSPEVGTSFLADVLPGLAASTQRAHRRSIHLLTEFMQTGIIRRRIVKLHEFPLDGEIGNAVLQHLDFLREQRRCEPTIHNHRRLLSYFIAGLSQKGIDSICGITEKVIVEFVDHAQTCKSEHFYAIRQFCSFLYERGMTSTNLSYVLTRSNFPQHEKLPSVYSCDEIKQIEGSIEQSSAVGKRDYAIFLLASRLGLRVSDIASLTWDNIDWDNGKITLYCSKSTYKI